MPGDMSKCVNFRYRWVSSNAPTQKYHICVYHGVFDWKMLLLLVGGVPMPSDMAKCCYFCVFLDITEVLSVASSQKYHICVYHGVFD